MMLRLPECTVRRRLVGLLMIALIAISLSGCGGGASLPASTTPVIDTLTVNGVAVTFSTTAVPVIQVPTKAVTALACTAHDPNHSPLTFDWSGVNGTVTTQSNTSMTSDTPATDGDSLVTCTVTNARGNSDARTVTLRAVTATTALTLVLSSASGTVATGATDLLTAVATDSSPVTYHFAIVSGTGTITQSATNPAQATFTAPATAETDTVLCYVTDMQGRSNTATTIILVHPAQVAG